MILKKKKLIESLNKIPSIDKDGECLNRGWYICMDGREGCLYLNKDGVITWGVEVDAFWETKEDALKFLKEWEAT